MPVNIDPKTGVAFGVIQANDVPELCVHITEHGNDLAYAKAVEDAESRVRGVLADFDAEEAVRFGVDAVAWTRRWLSRRFHSALYSIAPSACDGLAEAVIELCDRESLTFDIEEGVDAVVGMLKERGYFENDSDVQAWRLEENGCVYTYDGSLIWVMASPFATYCRTCSPCCPNAGDLGAIGAMEQSNNFAYTPAPKWLPKGVTFYCSMTRVQIANPDKWLPPIVVEWTDDDNAAAMKRGWSIFHGSRFEICRVDETDILESDDAALRLVVQGALRGDVLCIKAILSCGIMDPESLAADLSSMRDNGVVANIDPSGDVSSKRPLSTVKHRGV